MKIRNYKITFCLGSGYAGVGKVYTSKFAEQIIKQWMMERIKAGEPVVNGVLNFGKLFFAAKGRRQDGGLVTISPAATYSGDLLSLELKDRDVELILTSLAERIKNRLKQDRVYIIFQNKSWFV